MSEQVTEGDRGESEPVNNSSPKTYYAIARWCDPDAGKLVLVTTVEWKSVARWNPGTVLGIGETEDAAIDRAMSLVAAAEVNEIRFERDKASE